MSQTPVSHAFLNKLPVPIMLIKHLDETLNHPVVFVNVAFTQQVGYSQQDIPDKNTWWRQAYPDPSYQKVVENQWELAVELAREKQQCTVSMKVNIATKSGPTKRYEVTAEIGPPLIPGHYLIAFSPEK